MVRFMHQLFYPLGRNPHIPLDRELGAPQSQSGLVSRGKTCLCWELNHGFLANDVKILSCSSSKELHNQVFCLWDVMLCSLVEI